MATKPTPGASDGTYGTEMNVFLDVSLDVNGKIATEALQTDATAPSADAALANKKYVDDKVPVGDSPTVNDSQSNPMLKAHAYLTQTSGFVTAFKDDTGNTISGYVGATNDPVGAGLLIASSQHTASPGNPFVSFFVGDGKYFEINTAATGPVITWTPLVGSGGAPIDQD